MIATCLEGGLLHQGQCVTRCPVGFYANTVASCSRKESLLLFCLVCATLCLLLSSDDNLCIRFGPRSGLMMALRCILELDTFFPA